MLTRTLLGLTVLTALASQASAASVGNDGEKSVVQLEGRANSKKSAKHHPSHHKSKHPKKKHPKKHPHPHPHPHPNAHASPAAASTTSTAATTPVASPTPSPPAPPKLNIVCSTPTSDSTGQSMFNVHYQNYYNDMFSNSKDLDYPYARLNFDDGVLSSVFTLADPYNTVDLVPCFSDYMGYDRFITYNPTRKRSDEEEAELERRYPVNNNVWYGILRINNMLDTCLTAYKPIPESDRVAFEPKPCSYKEDDTQIAQFFRFSFDSDNNKVVQYLGDRYAVTNDEKGLHYNIYEASLGYYCPLGNTPRPDADEASFFVGLQHNKLAR